MRTYKFETSNGTYKLQLTKTNTYDRDFSHEYVSYKFISPNNTLLFEGKDFGYPVCRIRSNPESKDAAIELLGFLTCKPGDTDEEYFQHYTDLQLNFCNSFDCEELSLYAMED